MIPNNMWGRMPLEQRIVACHTDCMQHPEFAMLSGVVCVGKVVINDMPTAATNGRDVYYGREFCVALNQKQLRYVVLHENFHKALKHCTEYMDISRAYPRDSNVAMDYSLNQLIEDADPRFDFVQRPWEKGWRVDPKYKGMGFIEILRDLLKNPPKDCSGGGSGHGDGSFDEHIPGEGEMTPEEITEASTQIGDALRQGRVLAEKLRGTGKGGGVLDNLLQQRNTDWRTPMQEFIQSICVGDENSRFCPPNRRLLPLGFIMPSHFSEAVGELIVACDTSGSMGGVYPTVFGEIARICEHVRPDLVRVLWWDSEVNSEQVFTPADYDKLAGVMKPQGGGGTTVSCVAHYIEDKKYTPQAVIYLTDGDIESEYDLPRVPCLWGVVDNEDFRPRAGKKVNINSVCL
jgi:predicted metal-dependent peptidase